MVYYPDNIKEYWSGRVVKVRSAYGDETKTIGHITGFGLNSQHEITVKVLCAGDKEEKSYHTSRIILL